MKDKRYDSFADNSGLRIGEFKVADLICMYVYVVPRINLRNVVRLMKTETASRRTTSISAGYVSNVDATIQPTSGKWMRELVAVSAE